MSRFLQAVWFNEDNEKTCTLLQILKKNQKKTDISVQFFFFIKSCSKNVNLTG